MSTKTRSDARIDASDLAFDAADPTGAGASARLLAAMRADAGEAPRSRADGTRPCSCAGTTVFAGTRPMPHRARATTGTCRCSRTRRPNGPAFDGGLHGGIGCEVQTAGCDPDYPYDPDCVAGAYYYFHGNQFETVPDVATALATSPYRSIGRVFSAGSGGIGGATGTLIAPGYVLTAAHAVFFGGVSFATHVAFSLAQCGEVCKPYGSVAVTDVWFPEEYRDLAPQNPDTASTDELRAWKAFDFAILKLSQDPPAADGAGEPTTLPTLAVDAQLDLVGVSVRATGYACGRRPPSGPAIDPTGCRKELWPYTTSAPASILELIPSGAGGATIRADIEATKRMSGCPVWVSLLGTPVQIGVMIGSNCNDGGANWAAALTSAMMDRINATIYTGAHGSMEKHAITYGFFEGGGYGSGFLELADCPAL